MATCSVNNLDESFVGNRQESAALRDSSVKRWGIQIEEPGSTRPAEILEGRLYIASAVQANNWELLTSLKVTHIVNCSRSCNFDGTGTNPFSAWINYCSCGFADNASSDLTDALEKTWNFINTALSAHPRWVVLVHCASGISRSDSMHYIRSRHPAAEPNSSFVEQLKIVDKLLRTQRALEQGISGENQDQPASLSEGCEDMSEERDAGRGGGGTQGSGTQGSGAGGSGGGVTARISVSIEDPPSAIQASPPSEARGVSQRVVAERLDLGMDLGGSLSHGVNNINNVYNAMPSVPGSTRPATLPAGWG